MKKKINLKIINLILIFVAIGVFLIATIAKKSELEIDLKGSQENEKIESASQLSSVSLNAPFSPISGLACAEGRRRPIAVMLSGDAVTRPLSGLSEADLVFNMEVVTGSITRLMAVFICGNPKEIGSVRSARHDYILLASGLDAIYAHWGGSHFALDKLNADIMDNIDALPNPYNAFWRKAVIAQPHNGFTSISRLVGAAKKLGFRLENKFAGYPHLAVSESKSKSGEAKTLTINYNGAYAVKYTYEPSVNSYLRWRNGFKEMDKNTGQQVAAKNVAVMRAFSKPLEGDYNDVQVEGEGKAMVYRNGEEITATWKKDAKDQTSKLFFYDAKGAEIEFVPGQIWIEIVEPNQSVVWQ